MKLREQAIFVAVCECGAEADVDRINVFVSVPTPDGVARQKVDQLDLAAIGWTVGEVAPRGRPVLTAAGAATLDISRDTAADIARKTGVAQQTLRCPTCTTKARDREAVESAGAVVVEAGAVTRARGLVEPTDVTVHVDSRWTGSPGDLRSYIGDWPLADTVEAFARATGAAISYAMWDGGRAISLVVGARTVPRLSRAEDADGWTVSR